MADEKRTYSVETLGLPPLKMVLVNTQDDPQNRAAKTVLRPRRSKEQIEKEEIVRRIIEHLNKKP